MSTNPPTIKELCEKATPGPWQARFIYRLFSSARRDVRMVLRAPQEQDWPNAELIARCSPSVMLAVVEALTLADLNYARTNHSQPDLMGDDEFEAWKAVRTALNLLNGKAP